MKKNGRSILLFAAFLTLAILTRYLPHPPQFTALTAATLAGGLVFRKAWAVVLLPLLSLLISDALFAGFYTGAVLNYAALLLAGLVSFFAARGSLAKKAAGLVSGSLLFFLLSNLGVFLTSGMYAQSLNGFIDCYVMALPFYGFQVLGELVYGLVCAGIYFTLKASSTSSSSSALERSSL